MFIYCAFPINSRRGSMHSIVSGATKSNRMSRSLGNILCYLMTNMLHPQDLKPEDACQRSWASHESGLEIPDIDISSSPVASN